MLPADLRPPSRPPSIDPAVDSASELRFPSACSRSTSTRPSAAARWSSAVATLASYLSRSAAISRAGPFDPDLAAPVGERVRGLARPPVQLQVRIRRNLERQRAHEMIADVALGRRPVRLGVDRRGRNRVGHVGGEHRPGDRGRRSRRASAPSRRAVRRAGTAPPRTRRRGRGRPSSRRSAARPVRRSPARAGGAGRVAPDRGEPRRRDVDAPHGDSRRRPPASPWTPSSDVDGCGRSRASGADGARWSSCRCGRLSPYGRRPASDRDAGDLVAGHRAAEVAHRPAGGEHLRLVLARRAAARTRACRARRSCRRPRRRRRRRPPRSSCRRAGAPCRGRSAAGRSSTCRRWRSPCSRCRPGSASPARRRRRTPAPASSAS